MGRNTTSRIEKKLNTYKKKYGVLFVFRYPTPEAHRIIYIIKKVKGNKHVIIVDFLNHTEYDKRFGY